VPHTGTAAPLARPSAGVALELTAALRDNLLDPAAWQEGLEKYALAMHMAVALVDTSGRLLGSCLNPQPLWRFLCFRRPPSATCPFAAAPFRPCTCVAEALEKRTVFRTRDDAGLIHFAVPLALGNQNIGALIAGQIFDQYPEQMSLERVANKLGLSPAVAWEKARLQHPISTPMLKVYEDLLILFGEAFLKSRYLLFLEETRVADLARGEEQLRKANEELEKRVADRTAALEEAQQKALQAERLAAIGQVVAGLAHEGRNALQNRQASLEMLAMEMKDRPEALRFLAQVQDSQNILLQLFEHVREYAAPIKLNRQAVDVGALLQEVWQHTDGARQGRDARFSIDCVGVDLLCEADRFRLGQVLRNILDNSLQACGDPVVIQAICSTTDLAGRPALRIALRNNGPALTAEEMERIFEAFYTTKTHGTGLGMAIAKRIVEAHGGEIAVGRGMASGAEIVVTLPRARK
jgi:signal transduction histidine kinase